MRLSKVSCKYGAPMGRRTYPHVVDKPRTVRCSQVHLDSGGYDNGGAYWGHSRGERLYILTQENGDYCEFVRAGSRWQAVIKSGLDLQLFKVLQMDGRYTITLEWCGSVKPKFAVRFCNDYIQHTATHDEALAIVRQHYVDEVQP